MVKGKVLSVKIGIGLGECKILFVGGVFKRNEYLIVGESMRQACASECHCKKGGETVVSELIQEKMKEFYSFEEAEPDVEHGEGDGLKYYLCKSLQKNKIATRAQSLLMRNKFASDLIRDKISILKTYVPAAICLYLDIDKEIWSKENRLLTIMFLNLSIDLKDTESTERMLYIQSVVETVQKCVYKTRGSLNKFLMDDKGSVMLIVWGLPPMSAHDDSVRAVRSGLDIIQELKKEHLKCGAKIGITTGCCFTGICGNIGGRREYSLLGEIVNKSARFMQKSMSICNEKLKRNPNDASAKFQITICEQTRKLIENKIPSRWICNDYIKGFENPVDFYEPIQNEEFSNVIIKEIRTHKDNPIPDITDPTKATFGSLLSSNFIIGNEKEIEQLLSVLEDMHHNKESKTVLIKGIIGSGKSLLIRHVIDKFFKYFHMEIQPKEKFLFCSTQNSSIYYEPGNGISSFLREMYKAIIPFCNLKFDKVKILNEIDMELNEIGNLLNESMSLSYVHYIEEILQETLSSHYKLQNQNNSKIKEIFDIKTPEDKEFFVKREYPGGLSNKICEFFFKIVKIYKERVIPTKPLIIIVEDCHSIDQISLDFIRFISNKNKNESDIIPQMTIITSFQESLNPLEKTSISLFDFVDVTIKIPSMWNFLEKYIIDLILTQKKIGICRIDKKVKEILSEKLNINSPLFLGELLNSLIDQGFLKIIDFVLQPAKDFLDITLTNDWKSIQMPFIIEKVIGNIIDSLSPTEIIILKHASVIGNVFDINTLYSIISDLHISFENLVKMLYSFHFNNLIEILYDLDVYKIVAKFSIPFLREIFYQRMTVETRNTIHLNIARKMQISRCTYLSRKKELILLKSHLAEAEMSITDRLSQTKQNHQEIEGKNENICLIKDLCGKLKVIDLGIEDEEETFSKKIIKDAICQKKSSTNITWNSRYIVLSKTKFEYWPSQIDFEKNAPPLGCIFLKNIYQVFIGKDFELFFSKRNILVIKFSSYIKGNELKDAQTFYFSLQSYKELQNWITILNFMRIKAMYDELCFHYGTIPLPLPHEKKVKIKKNFKKQFQLYSLDKQFVIPGYNYPLDLSTFNNNIGNQRSINKKISIFSKYYIDIHINDPQQKSFEQKKTLIFKLIHLGLVHLLGSIQRGIKENLTTNSKLKCSNELLQVIKEHYFKAKEETNIIRENDNESFTSIDNDQKYSIASAILRGSNLSYSKGTTSMNKLIIDMNMPTGNKLINSQISEKEIEDSYCYSRSYNQSVSKRSKVYTQMTSDFSSGLELLNEEK